MECFRMNSGVLLLRVVFPSAAFRTQCRYFKCSSSLQTPMLSRAHRLRAATISGRNSLLPVASCRLSSDVAPSTSWQPNQQNHEVLRIRTVNGLHELSIPMVSRRELCRFTLQPFDNTLGDLFTHIRKEDRAIDQLQAQTEDGEIISTKTSMESLLKRRFYLTVNSTRYLVQQDQTDRLESQEPCDVSDNVRHLVASLYRTINLEQYFAVQQRNLLAQQTELLLQLEPLEKMKKELERNAEKRTRVLKWVGLGLMGAQFGFMARLTWWEYSWDIMEPVTYFVGYATTIAMFAYYVITREEYIFPRVRDREFLIALHRKSKKQHLDLQRYNDLRTRLSHVERDLQRLRDPVEVHLSLPHLRSVKD